MENTGYIALSRQIALERKMDIVSNNIANMSTSGYQSQHMMFSEEISRADRNEPISMVMDYGTYRNLTAGPITTTGNDLDVALNGNGFLVVQGVDGEEKYSRNGSFQLNELRELVNSSGLRIIDEGGKPIEIPEGQTQIKISSSGAVSTEDGEVGQLKLVRFDNPQDMELIGGSLFETTQQALPDETTQVMQGMIEQSNVNPIIEMTNMIEINRSYQTTARLLQNEHDRQRDAIRKLAQV